jgi:hypothetical protein
VSYDGSVNWPVLWGYVGLLTAIVVGGVLGYRKWHRPITGFLGLVCGIAIVIIANTFTSNDPINGGDLSDQIILAFVGYAVILLYTSSFAVGAALDWVVHRRHRAVSRR